jgi:hypothetical protein
MNTNITVTIERRADFLRLRWNDGNRRSLELGLRDAPANRAFATATKKKIENDWADGKYGNALGVVNALKAMPDEHCSHV